MPLNLQPPVSFQLTPAQLAWLDARRQRGAISRSAALRQALDDLMAATTEQRQQPIQP
jgi:Arc/MetJ-type ribon-helix-helix transcriptional regulator